MRPHRLSTASVPGASIFCVPLNIAEKSRGKRASGSLPSQVADLSLEVGVEVALWYSI